jgi:hypothetical protein
MGITNQLPPSRLAQAGVIANTAARPTSPYTGQMLFQLDTKQLLIWDGAAWVMALDTDTPPGLQLVKTQTVGTGVSSVVVSGAFSTEFDDYLIQVSNTVVSANQPNLGIRLGATATNYAYAGHYQAMSLTTLTGDQTSAGTYFIMGACGNGTTGAGRVSMSVTVKNPNLSAETFFTSMNGSLAWNNYYNGFLNNSTQYTDFTILPSSGNLTGGTIRVYGYRN